MTPKQIEALQRKLAEQGLYTGEIDGVMGPQTKAARDKLLEREDRAAQAETQRQQSEAQARAAEAAAKSAEARAREAEIGAEREAAERAPGRQALEFGKYAAPIAGGIYMGHHSAKGIEKRQQAMSPKALRNMSTARRFAPYAARSAARFLPEAGVAFWGAEQLRESNPVLSEVSRAGGTGLLAAGLYNIGEGAVRSLTPPGNALARAAPPPGTPPGAPPAGAPPGPPPATPPATPPGTPPGTPPASPSTNSERLIRAAREAGATGKLTKAQAAQHLAGNVTAENRAAVARELGVKPGRNFATRLSGKVRDLATSTKRIPSFAGPIVAAAVGYDAAQNAAEARGAGPVERTATGAGAATVAGGTAYGAQKLARMPFAQRAISRVVPPVAAYGLAADAIDEATYTGPEDPVGGFESPFGQQAMSGYDASRNALSAADPGGSEFGKALDAFIQFATQEMAGQGGGEEMRVSP